MKKGIASVITVLALAIVVSLGLGLGVYFGTLSLQKPPSVKKLEGHFGQFGKSNVIGDQFSEYTKTTWTDDTVDIPGNATFEEYSLSQVANESFTGDSSKYVNLNNDDFEPGSITVRNATDDSVVSSSDYTMNLTDGGIKVSTTWNGASMKITYNYMPTQSSHGRIGKIFFEIDGGATESEELQINWAENNITSSNTFIREAKILDDESQTVEKLSTGGLQKGDSIDLNGLQEGEYYLYLVFDQNAFTPNVNSGTYEKAFDIDFELNSPDADSDEPTEVEGFTVYAKTLAP